MKFTSLFLKARKIGLFQLEKDIRVLIASIVIQILHDGMVRGEKGQSISRGTD